MIWCSWHLFLHLFMAFISYLNICFDVLFAWCPTSYFRTNTLHYQNKVHNVPLLLMALFRLFNHIVSSTTKPNALSYTFAGEVLNQKFFSRLLRLSQNRRLHCVLIGNLLRELGFDLYHYSSNDVQFYLVSDIYSETMQSS